MMDTPDLWLCFIEFKIEDLSRFHALQMAFEACKHDKEAGALRDIDDWLEFFDDQALSHFWWPAAEERDESDMRREQMQVGLVTRQLDEPALDGPWEFEGMIDALENGEYDLIACLMLTEDRGRLEFRPHAWPYGGTGSLKMLLTAFDCRPVAEDAGFGLHQLA